jgi:general secretion pathway protein G
MTAIRRTSNRTASLARKGFTLVEILIVVIILGILAAIVIPQFTNASTDARKSNMASQDQTIKSQISLYMLQHGDTPPAASTYATNNTVDVLFSNYLTISTDVNGNATTTAPFFGPYLQGTPTNPLTGVSTVVAVGTAAATTTGWYYNNATGEFHGANTLGASSDDGN